MSSDKIKIRQILELLNSYKYQCLAIFAITLGFSMTLTKVLEKRFKSQFEINVYSKYFQNPLISEIVPGVYNIPEMRFTIDSMVKEAINDDYIDQLAKDYQLYSLQESPEEVARKRQFLRDRFSYYSTGGQSYRVSFEDSDPYRAKKITEKTLDRVKGHFINSRIDTIEIVKGIMLERLQALNATQKIGTNGTEKALASKSPDVLRSELKTINGNISALSKQYNINHPKLQELLLRKRTVSAWLEEFKGELDSAANNDSVVAMPVDKEINNVLTGKFFSKFHNFNMALDIEKRSLESYFGVIERPQLPTFAVWPKKRLFAILGFLIGLVACFLYIFIKEVLAPNQKELLEMEALKLNTRVLGECSPSAPGDVKGSIENSIRSLNPETVIR